jgi:tetratricopeptide (TPR) repeat protein
MRSAADADQHTTLALILLAKIYMDEGKQAEAARVSAELKARAPDDPAAYGALAAFYEATGQKEKAAEELQALLAAKPKEASIKAHLTDVLLDLNRVDEAAQLNDELLGAAPGDPRALYSRGRILLTQHKYTEAKQALDRTVQANPQSGSAHYFLGMTETFLGFPALARASFARALELSPDMAEAVLASADLEVQSRDYDAAVRLANKAIQKNPKLTAAYVTAAKAWLAKGNSAEAEAQLRLALDRDPASLAALGVLVDVETSLGRVHEAVRWISAAASQHPRNANLQFLLGVAYFRLNDLARAETAIQQALALDPKTPDAHSVLAEISTALGSWDQAIDQYKTAITENPKKPESYMALSGLYEKRGNSEDAKRAAERARELDPASPFIANNLAYLYLQYGGDAARALSLAEEARQKLPDSPVVFDTIGWAHYKLQSPDAAVAKLSESVRRAPANPVYRYHLGMAYIQAGRFNDAARSLQQALSINAHFVYADDAKAALGRIARGPA